MKLLITGSRKLQPEHYDEMATYVVRNLPLVTEIWHGGATGGDQLAHRLAEALGLKETVIRPNYAAYPAKAAPLHRNIELVHSTDYTLALHTGEMTSGTAHTTRISVQTGTPTVALNVRTGEAIKLR